MYSVSMAVRFSKIYRRFYSVVTSISKSKIMNQEKCYFRYIEKEDKIDISFLLEVKNAVRQFNFSRKPTESLEILLSRIGTNVEKVLNKANKKKENKDKTRVEVKFYDDKNSPIPENITCAELFTLKNPVKLKIIDHVFETVFNSPWIVTVNLPQSILAGFPVYPENLFAYYTNREESLYNWYTGFSVNEKGNEIAEVHIKWELVGNGFTYVPRVQDIGKKLKLECIPVNNEHIGPAVETVSKNIIEAGPGTCPFETRHMFTTKKLEGTSFRCVSYNILADLYCDSDHTRTVLHPYCPPYALQIDYRKQLIVKELLGYNADIISLQEVDRKIFNNCLYPLLQSDGLEGVFYKKGKEVAEGLACFYRKDRFSILEEEQILLYEALQTKTYLQPIWNVIKRNSALLERLLNRSTVASATVLQSLDNPNEITLVGNTHLYFHPDADHIRLIQGGIIIYWLRDMRNKLKYKYPNKRVSLILCGDFNTVPSCGIYKLFTTGIAPDTLPDWRSNESEAVENLTLVQDIPLGSACGTPPFTNFTVGFADCLDYIFYDTSNLEVEQVIPLPSVEELKANTALPSVVFPSDHIALVSDLRYK